MFLPEVIYDYVNWLYTHWFLPIGQIYWDLPDEKHVVLVLIGGTLRHNDLRKSPCFIHYKLII